MGDDAAAEGADGALVENESAPPLTVRDPSRVFRLQGDGLRFGRAAVALALSDTALTASDTRTGAVIVRVPLANAAGARRCGVDVFGVWCVVDGARGCCAPRAAPVPRRAVRFDFRCRTGALRDKWTQSVLCALRGVRDTEPVARRHYLVLINPTSGRRGALKVFETVREIFESAAIDLTVRQTDGPRHAERLVQRVNLETFDAIVAVGGDGMVHEVVNGLLTRDDWSTAIKTPIGVIPAGTGNGLAKSLGIEDAAVAAVALCKGAPIPVNVFAFEQPSAIPSVRRFGVLAAYWALLADIDRESEACRCCGALRSSIWAVHRILSLRSYNGTLSFLLAPSVPTPPSLEAKAVRTSADATSASAAEAAAASAASIVRALQKSDDRDAARAAENAAAEAAQSVVSSPKPASPPVRSIGSSHELVPAFSDDSVAAASDVQLPGDLLARPPTMFSTPIGAPPEHWKTVTGPFQVACAVNCPFVDTGTMLAPKADLGDGCLDLVLVRNSNRSELLKMFGGIEKGEHVGHPKLEYYKVHALELLPGKYSDSFLGFLNVDGETLQDYCPIRLEVMPFNAAFLAPTWKSS